MVTATLTLSPLVTAYALEAGLDIVSDTSAGAWGYYVAFVPLYAPGRKPDVRGPFSPLDAVRNALRPYSDERVAHIVARFPAGTPYAYTL